MAASRRRQCRSPVRILAPAAEDASRSLTATATAEERRGGGVAASKHSSRPR
jgi:hypothetical protein